MFKLGLLTINYRMNVAVKLSSVQIRNFSNKLPNHVKLTMPSLSPTMEKGNLAKWNKKVGDEVGPGDILAEVETDKATVDFEMQEEGFVAKLLVEEGAQDIKLGDLVAILVEKKEDIAAFKDYKPDSGASSAAPKTVDNSKKLQDDREVQAKHTQEPPKGESKEASAKAPKHDSGDRVFASPYAKKLANEKGLDLGDIEGTGPRGRIVAADIEEYKGKSSTSEASAKSAGVSSAPVSANYSDIPLSQMRKIIAQRLTLSKDTIPHYYVTVECEVDKLLALRAKLNAHSESKISVNDMVIKAASLASVKVP